MKRKIHLRLPDESTMRRKYFLSVYMPGLSFSIFFRKWLYLAPLRCVCILPRSIGMRQKFARHRSTIRCVTPKFGHQFANDSFATRLCPNRDLFAFGQNSRRNFPSVRNVSSRFRPAPLRLPPQLPICFRRFTGELFVLGMACLRRVSEADAQSRRRCPPSLAVVAQASINSRRFSSASPRR